MYAVLIFSLIKKYNEAKYKRERNFFVITVNTSFRDIYSDIILLYELLNIRVI